MKIWGEVEIVLTDKYGKIKKKVLQRNMLMGRFFDRLAMAMTNCGGTTLGYEALSSLHDPLHNKGITQHVQGIELNAVITAFIDDYKIGFHPELIGLGQNSTPPNKKQNGLIAPFIANGYRNAHTSMEPLGPILGGSTTDNDSIRIGTIYPPGVSILPIWELGLFWNQWMGSVRAFDGANQIDFTRGGAGNLAWEIYNVHVVNTAQAYQTLRDDSLGLPNTIFSWDRLNQVITLGNIPVPSPANNVVLISFSPHRDHVADIGGIGNITSFTPPPDDSVLNRLPQMVARIALEEVIEKFSTDLLSVVWYIHFDRQ